MTSSLLRRSRTTFVRPGNPGNSRTSRFLPGQNGFSRRENGRHGTANLRKGEANADDLLMPRNKLQKTPAALLPARARRFCDVAGKDPVTLGLTSELVGSIAGLADDLDLRNAVVLDLQNAYHAAVLDRDGVAAACVAALASASNRVYATVPGDAVAIAELGLSPRSTSKARIVPKTPFGVVAALRPNGEVELKWDRSGNAAEVIFVVEASRDGGAWENVESTTKTRLALRGFVPGVTAHFRIRATKNGVSATVSTWATIYPEDGPALRLAA